MSPFHRPRGYLDVRGGEYTSGNALATLTVKEDTAGVSRLRSASVVNSPGLFTLEWEEPYLWARTDRLLSRGNGHVVKARISGASIVDPDELLPVTIELDKTWFFALAGLMLVVCLWLFRGYAHAGAASLPRGSGPSRIGPDKPPQGSLVALLVLAATVTALGLCSGLPGILVALGIGAVVLLTTSIASWSRPVASTAAMPKAGEPAERTAPDGAEPASRLQRDEGSRTRGSGEAPPTKVAE